jgi:hypothetical protein
MAREVRSKGDHRHGTSIMLPRDEIRGDFPRFCARNDPTLRRLREDHPRAPGGDGAGRGDLA